MAPPGISSYYITMSNKYGRNGVPFVERKTSGEVGVNNVFYTSVEGDGIGVSATPWYYYEAGFVVYDTDINGTPRPILLYYYRYATNSASYNYINRVYVRYFAAGAWSSATTMYFDQYSSGACDLYLIRNALGGSWQFAFRRIGIDAYPVVASTCNGCVPYQVLDSQIGGVSWSANNTFVGLYAETTYPTARTVGFSFYKIIDPTWWSGTYLKAIADSRARNATIASGGICAVAREIVKTVPLPPQPHQHHGRLQRRGVHHRRRGQRRHRHHEHARQRPGRDHPRPHPHGPLLGQRQSPADPGPLPRRSLRASLGHKRLYLLAGRVRRREPLQPQNLGARGHDGHGRRAQGRLPHRHEPPGRRLLLPDAVRARPGRPYQHLPELPRRQHPGLHADFLPPFEALDTTWFILYKPIYSYQTSHLFIHGDNYGGQGTGSGWEIVSMYYGWPDSSLGMRIYGSGTTGAGVSQPVLNYVHPHANAPTLLTYSYNFKEVVGGISTHRLHACENVETSTNADKCSQTLLSTSAPSSANPWKANFFFAEYGPNFATVAADSPNDFDGAAKWANLPPPRGVARISDARILSGW
jgi:hypothetical protein